MVILSFGSGVNMEDPSPANIAKFKALADYAHSKGIEMGGYSLLASRHIDDADDVINPKTGKVGGAIRRLALPGQPVGPGLLQAPPDIPAGNRLQPAGARRAAIPATSVPQPAIRAITGLLTCSGPSTAIWRTCIIGAAPTASSSTCRTGNSLPGRTRPAWGIARRTGPSCRVRSSTSTRARTCSMAPGRRPQRWAGCSCRWCSIRGAARRRPSSRLASICPTTRCILPITLASASKARYRGPRLYDTEATKALVTKWVAWFKRHRAILEFRHHPPTPRLLPRPRRHPPRQP